VWLEQHSQTNAPGELNGSAVVGDGIRDAETFFTYIKMSEMA